MSGKRQHINIHFVYIYMDVSDRLNRVGVEHDTGTFGYFAYFGNRHNSTDFVVGSHYAYHNGCILYRSLYVLG